MTQHKNASQESKSNPDRYVDLARAKGALALLLAAGSISPMGNGFGETILANSAHEQATVAADAGDHASALTYEAQAENHEKEALVDITEAAFVVGAGIGASALLSRGSKRREEINPAQLPTLPAPAGPPPPPQH